MKRIANIGILMILLFAFLNSNAQSDSANTDKVTFKLGIYYNTGLNYYGRTDSLKSSGFFPMAELWFTKNFYINAAPVFVVNSSVGSQYAGTITTAGLQFNRSGHFNTHIYFVKPFYKDNSQLVQSALKGQLAAEFTWLNKAVDLTFGADTKFSDKTDYGATAGIDHSFRIDLPGNAVLAILPSAYLYAGTQQFTNSYYKKTGGFLIFPGTEQQVTESSNKFNILSYEFSVPVVLAKGKFQLLATPAYVLPQNLVTIPGHPELSERGKQLFYATIGAKVSF